MSSQATRFGVSLLRAHPALWSDLAQEAEQLGFESVWISDHLVLPVDINPADYPDGRPPINPKTPIFDVMVFLAALAGTTSNLRLGTFVYQLGLRHPFVAARSIATLDVVSSGRLELGVGAGWSPDEWRVANVDFATRGRRLDEALLVCRKLWTEPVATHSGEFFSFPPVAFEPKPVQQPHIPVHVGGESNAAFRRVVRDGDGWVGMHHTPVSALAARRRLFDVAEAHGRKPADIAVTVAAQQGDTDADAWREAGIDRVIVSPWTSSRGAMDGLRQFARDHLS